MAMTPSSTEQVPVAECLEGDPAAAVVGHGGQSPLGSGVVAAEVGPPQAGSQRQAEHGHAGQGQVDRGGPAAPVPMATIDSPRATITTRPWRSTK